MKIRAYDDFYSPLFEPDLIQITQVSTVQIIQVSTVALVLIGVVVGVASIVAYLAARRPEPRP